MSLIPKTHPRAKSLYIRERLVHGFDDGLVAKEGLMAHGRGEAFDYLLGEKTSKYAQNAINLFYANEKRKKNIVHVLRKAGAKEILGVDSKSSKRISGLDSARRIVYKNGIYKADVVLVLLENGDRTLALKKAGKKV